MGNNSNNTSKQNAEFIRNIIEENHDNIAFIVGNGIHLYVENKEGKKRCSWKELLLTLWNKNNNNKLNDIDKGISYTEFYDLLELKNWNHHKDKRKEEFHKTLLGLSKSYTRISDDMFNKMNMLSAIPIDKKPNLIRSLSESEKTSLRSLIKAKSKLAESIKSCLESNVSDDEAISLMMNLLNDEYVKESLFNQTKMEIVNIMKNWEISDVIYNLVSSIKKLNSLLLTTNYDDVLSKSINADFQTMKDLDGKIKRSDWYPWNCYYGDKNTTPDFGFGIWHINGMIKYYRSIVIGLCDYTRSLDRARGMIQGKPIFQCENFNGKNQNYWIGYNTWLHFIFNRSLFVFGLSLDENEVFLRWLLIQRAKYLSAYGKPQKAWFIVGPNDSINDGKRLFIESVGFEIISISDYKTIYEDVWQ